MRSSNQRQQSSCFACLIQPCKRRGSKRCGTATVELAVCLPVLVLLVFGGIEAAHFIQLKQDLTICAYEAAKKSTRDNSSMQDAIDRFNEIATAKGITGASISFEPNFNSATTSGTEITVQVTAPAESNYEMPVKFFQNQNLSAEVTMVRQQY